MSQNNFMLSDFIFLKTIYSDHDRLKLVARKPRNQAKLILCECAWERIEKMQLLRHTHDCKFSDKQQKLFRYASLKLTQLKVLIAHKK